ncbi:LytTR family DNA-binding domain-containing protein [Bifidobacterium sp. ESL0798]|uniref:LytR/AlgR family response regulator transcription factor n=1 Tax=Bifidobacterium sp. ESL0798 TaxID=2983235 RepID=UPI0023F955C6|nr:LytTR family DNA-binding domain-containing protein [Bifidobacterium sp. ESL0798]WEV74679.1 LytTR family DNA-binding domain-containing protein [Bifidobacterium sp. ESL0798]
MLRLAIAEDNANDAQKLRDYIARYATEHGVQYNIHAFSDGVNLAEEYRPEFDIIFLDIEMPLLDGISTARRIRESDPSVIIVFTTNLAQYAITGYEVNAFDYLLKPITYPSFSSHFERILSSIPSHDEGKAIVITARTSSARVLTDDIVWIESRGHLLTFHTINGVYQSSTQSLKSVYSQLRDQDFFQCNKGCLVNLKFVERVEHDEVVLVRTAHPADERNQPARLQVSRARHGPLIQALGDSIAKSC